MKKIAALVGVALLVASGIALAGVQEQPGERPGDGRQARAGRLEQGRSGRHGRLGMWLHRRHPARAFVRSLEITDQQKEQARGVAQSLRPIVDEVRPQARAILGRVRELARSGDRAGARELVRTELRPLLQGALQRAEPLVQPLVGTLTPAQREKLEARAAAHGRVFDEARFTRHLTRRLALRGARLPH